MCIRDSLRPAPVGAAQRRQGARLLCERRLPGRDRGGTRPLPRHDGSAGRGGAAGHAGQRSGLGRVGHLQQLDVGHAGAADEPPCPDFGSFGITQKRAHIPPRPLA